MKKELSLKEQKEGMSMLRKSMGIKDSPIANQKGDIQRIKIDEAEFFPNPPSFWKESKINIYQLMSSDAEDYIRCWDYNGLHVLASVVRYNDGREWLHISFSRKNRMPEYKDMKLVRNSFIGEDKKSIMVFPEKSHYVNISETCLHLWYTKECPIPDFDINIEGIGPSI